MLSKFPANSVVEDKTMCGISRSLETLENVTCNWSTAYFCLWTVSGSYSASFLSVFLGWRKIREGKKPCTELRDTENPFRRTPLKPWVAYVTAVAALCLSLDECQTQHPPPTRKRNTVPSEWCNLGQCHIVNDYMFFHRIYWWQKLVRCSHERIL